VDRNLKSPTIVILGCPSKEVNDITYSASENKNERVDN